jgi:Sec-independent protein translocase protein TatA
MLGVGPQELMVLGGLLLLLVVFGSDTFASTARGVGQFLGGARRTVEDAKSELVPEEVEEARRAIHGFKGEALYGTEQDKQDKGRRKA